MYPPHSGAMTPDFCVAQRISPSIGARRCPWLPKCSAINATRRRATRRDTRIGASRARHEVRPVTSDGKHRSAISDCPSTGRHGVNECRRYACRCTQRGSSRSHADGLPPGTHDRADSGLLPRTGASVGVRLRAKCGLTSAGNTFRHLHRYQPQYLTEYLDHNMSVYQGQRIGRHRRTRRVAGVYMHADADTDVRASRCQQTCTAWCCFLNERRTCNAIVTSTCRRVVFKSCVDAAHLIVEGTRQPVKLSTYVHRPTTADDAAESNVVACVWRDAPSTTYAPMCFTTRLDAPNATYPQACVPITMTTEHVTHPAVLPRIGCKTVACVWRDAASATYAPMCFTTAVDARNDTCPQTCVSIAMPTGQATRPAAVPRIGCQTAWQTTKRMQ